MDWKPILLQYSMRITGNHWDAEDLTQEAWLKLLEAVRIKPERPITRAYLYRIVKNTWIDVQRKKPPIMPIAHIHETGVLDSSLSTRELLEQLAERVPARMAVILLLMDVFDFTAKETAAYVHMKEAAVQVTLGRARKKLKQAAQHIFEPSEDKVQQPFGESPVDWDGLVAAFRKRDPDAIYRSYLGMAKQGLQLAKLQIAGGGLRFTFRDPDGNFFQIISE